MGSVSLSVNYINKATFFLLNGGVFLIGFGVRVGNGVTASLHSTT